MSHALITLSDGRQVTLTPQQLSAMTVAELMVANLGACSSLVRALGVPMLSDALQAAKAQLEAAHERFVSDSRRAVSIAAPAEVAKLTGAA